MPAEWSARSRAPRPICAALAAGNFGAVVFAIIKAHVRLALIALLAIVMAATIAMATQTFADDSIHAIKAARPAPPISTCQGEVIFPPRQLCDQCGIADTAPALDRCLAIKHMGDRHITRHNESAPRVTIGDDQRKPIIAGLGKSESRVRVRRAFRLDLYGASRCHHIEAGIIDAAQSGRDAGRRHHVGDVLFALSPSARDFQS